MHQGPAVGRSNQHLGRAGLAMPPGVLAGHVDVELVMRMLDDRDAQAQRVEMRDQPRQQRGLARTAPACKADDFHPRSVSASDLVFDGTSARHAYIGLTRMSC